MELDKCIVGRRSARHFKLKDVDFKLVNECVNAARYAPSAGNSQCWKFIVVRNKDAKKKIVKCCEDQDWMENAPVLVVACADLHKVGQYYGARGESLYAVQGVAAAVQNFLLKAHDPGLNTCWVGSFDEDGVNRCCGISGDARPQAVIALGYSDEDPENPGREPLDNFLFFEAWGKREDKARSVWPLANKLDKLAEKLHEKISNKK